MGTQINTAVSAPRFDGKTDLYQLKIGKIILESDSTSHFHIRKNELLRINGKILPEKIRFVVQDETINTHPELVNVKVIIERINAQEFIIQFEESSETDRWYNEYVMIEYYEERVEQLLSRQYEVFDLAVQTLYNDDHCFLIQYSVHIADIDTTQINKLIRKATDAVHSSSEEFNNSFDFN